MDDIKYGQVIKNYLEANKIKKNYLASKMGITPQGLNSMLKGNMRYDTVCRIATILGVSVSELTNDTPESRTACLSETDQKLLALHEEQKKLALAFFEFLKEKT